MKKEKGRVSFREVADAAIAEEARRGRSRPASNYMSAIGHQCPRKWPLSRLRAEELSAEPWEPRAIRMMTLGREIERMILFYLERECGVEILDKQEMLYLPNDLSGKLDGSIAVGKKRIPVEVKSIGDWALSKVDRIEDFVESETLAKYYSGYPTQGNLYAAAKRADETIWILCPRDDPFNFKEIIQPANDDRVAVAVQRAAMTTRILAGKETVPPAEWVLHCDICDHAEYCHGVLSRDGDELEEIDDPQLDVWLDEREALKPAASRLSEIERNIKARCSEKQFKTGKWIVGGKTQKRGAYQVEASEYWRGSYKRVEEKKNGEEIEGNA